MHTPFTPVFMTEREGIKGERSEGHFLCYCTKYLKLRNELFAQKQSLTSKGFLKLNTVEITDKKRRFDRSSVIFK